MRRVPQKNVTKTEIYQGSYHVRIFVFLNILQIFVPRLEILFYINHYYLVCFFSTLQVSSLILGQKFGGDIFILTISAAKQQKRDNSRNNNSIRSVRKYSFIYQVFAMEFFGQYNVFPFIPFAPVHSWEFLCVLYASELASVGNYLSLMWHLIGICCGFDNSVRFQFYSLTSTLVGCQIQLQMVT